MRLVSCPLLRHAKRALSAAARYALVLPASQGVASHRIAAGWSVPARRSPLGPVAIRSAESIDGFGGRDARADPRGAAAEKSYGKEDPDARRRLWRGL